MTPAYEEGFDEKVIDINIVYQEAPDRAKQGQRTESLDEMTGVQALERKHRGLPICPGKVERREFEYIRHGTLSFICNFNVASGELVACTASKTRNERDLLILFLCPLIRGKPSIHAKQLQAAWDQGYLLKVITTQN